MVQVAERTAADKKGGHLAKRISDGRLMLRESAMCPDEDKASFEDISKHKFFNTNNLWVNLPKLKARAPPAPLALEGLFFLHLFTNCFVAQVVSASSTFLIAQGKYCTVPLEAMQQGLCML